jgi:hypothetical protein
MFQMTNATVSDTEVSLRIRFFGCFDAHGTVAIAGVWSGSRAPFRPTGEYGRSTPTTGPACRPRRRVLWAIPDSPVLSKSPRDD